MPEYLAPGVYVEERSFRSKSIEGVSTSTTGFVGATRYGPIDGEPELITTFGQFERIYGGLDPLVYGGKTSPNFLAYAARAFFDNGGARLYVARAYKKPGAGDGCASSPIPAPVPVINQANDLAVSVTQQVQAALNQAIGEGQKAKAAAMTLLQYATPPVLAALMATAAPSLNYDYGSGDKVAKQLADFIATLSGAEKTAVQAAFTAAKPLIDTGDNVYVKATTLLTDAEAAQGQVSPAVGQGRQAGDQVLETALPADPIPEASTAITTLTKAGDKVKTSAGDLAAPSAELDQALRGLTDDATADTMAKATALITAAEKVVTDAKTTVAPLKAAARAARVGQRAALRNAKAKFVARFPGEAGNMRVTVSGRLGANTLTSSDSGPAVPSLRDGDLVVIHRGTNAFIYHTTGSGSSWSFGDSSGGVLALDALNPNADKVYPLILTVQADLPGRFAQPAVWSNLTVSNSLARRPDSATEVLALNISNRMQAMETPLVLEMSSLQLPELASHLLGLTDWQTKLSSTAGDRFIQSQTFHLEGGSDGDRPDAEAYKGTGDESTPLRSGLKALESLEEISIVAAPGYSYDYATNGSAIRGINQELISHCERLRYRVAVLDSPDKQPLSGVRDYAAVLESKYAALYYPWLRIVDPVSNQELNVPPSGYVAGIYARSDQKGVHKAPANESVLGPIGLETYINKAQQDILNPLGINCIRYFEGRGVLVWGARTVSSDPEWKYLNIRRYFIYLEASIDRSTQWAVFEPNGEALWANVRRTVESFLETEWREGRLAGASTDEAYFVRCDRSTMSQNDLDNGRLICLIGVAPLYPAEFVIFRIGQWTADRQ